jgi:hypothetical protein
MNADQSSHIPPDVRAAISTFLNACQKEAQPFAIAEAIGAVRRVFPSLDISDAELVDAITSEAAAAGFDIEYDAAKAPQALRRRAIERWENEGGAPHQTDEDRQASDQIKRQKADDTDGTQRRARETKNRNRLI